ncbi:MAG: cation transporter [Ruminococcaceae bacterium]|nr:cation transporter [Oscillospiraceae bacterium]
MTKLIVRMFLKNKNPDTPGGRESYGKLAGIVGIICNLFLSGLKFVLGYLTHSVSITADATNNIADAGSSIITLIGFRLSEKPADEDHPYGHARIEYITGLIISFLVMLIGFEIFKTSVEKIITPEAGDFRWVTAVILVVSIIVKLWLSRFNKSLGKLIKSTALDATAADSRNDCISTLAVLVAAVISHFTGFNLDGYMGVGVAIFILISGIGLIKETVGPLLGQAPSKELYEKIEQKMLSYENVLGVHDLLVHSYGPGSYFASAHVEMDANINVLVCHDIMDKIERDFLKQDNIHLVVHLDPTVLDCEETNELKEVVRQILYDIDPIITFHDFRVVVGDTAKNVLFDIVVPPKYKLSDKDLKHLIKNRVNEAGNGNLYAVIVVDRSYGVLKSEND